MRILVTGAAGFIGQIVSKALLDDQANELVLVDVVEAPVPAGARFPDNAHSIKADLVHGAERVVSNDLDAAILLHGVMSSAAEADFELGYQVNVDASRSLLFQLVKTCPGIRVLYASSEAVYGNPLPRHPITEADVPTPELSYGCQKIICETMINDLTRRGLINGFSLRFPTISIRPGKPSPAVSAFLSGIIREPLNGVKCVVPLKDRMWKHWMCSPRMLVHNICAMLHVPSNALRSHTRSINMPGFAVTVTDMLHALEIVGGKDKLEFVEEREVPEMQSVLYGLMAAQFDNTLALSLGLKQDVSFVDSVRDYVQHLEAEKQLSNTTQ